MPFFATLVAALLLLCSCCFFPGFFFVRRLRWTPLEKLSGSIALSLILLYLGAWTAYCFGPADPRPVYATMVAATVVLAALSARESLRLFRSFRIRQTLLAWAGALAFTLAMLSMIRVYGGAGWVGDWAEHFQRSLFFLNRLPASTVIAELYTLPARPPMQNVLAAFFLGLTADRYEIFQVVFAFLNILVFLPCLLLMPAFGLGKRRAVLPQLVLFVSSPFLVEHATYTWTKALSAFFVILAVALYLAGWRKNDRARTIAAFLSLAAAILTHYSAGPYAVVLGGHYLWRFSRTRPVAFRELAWVVLSSALLMATWFGWSLKTYGWKTTVASNSAVTGAPADAGKNFEKIAGNLVDTLVPAVLRDAGEDWKQPNPDGRLRDQAFVFYQLNAIFAIGVLGGPIVVWLALRRLLRRSGEETWFWRIAVPAVFVLGVAVVGERDVKGVAQLTLLPLVTLGVSALAAAFFRQGVALRLAIVAGCCLDFGLGVFLHGRMESLENTPRQTIYGDLAYRGYGRFETETTERGLSDTVGLNWMIKHKRALFQRWLENPPRHDPNDILFLVNWRQLADDMQARLGRDTANWGGWFERNQGELRHLGDRVAGPTGAGTDLASAMFLVLFAAGVGLLIRQAVRAPSPAPVPAPIGRTSKMRRSGRNGRMSPLSQ